GPAIVCPVRICVAIAEEPASGAVLRRELRVKSGHCIASRMQKVGIYRHGLDLGAAHFVITGIVSGLIIPKRFVWLALTRVDALGIEEPEVIVIGRDWPKEVVPHDLVGDVRVVWIQQWKWLPCHETHERTMVRAQANLRRVLLGRFLVGGRPIDALGRNDLDGHAVLKAPEYPRADEVFHLVSIVTGNEVPGLDLGAHRAGEHEEQHSEGDEEPHKPDTKISVAMHSLPLPRRLAPDRSRVGFSPLPHFAN